MTPLQTRRDEVCHAIAAHLVRIGPFDWALVQSRFPDVPQATFWRCVKRVKKAANATRFISVRGLDLAGTPSGPRRANSLVDELVAEFWVEAQRRWAVENLEARWRRKEVKMRRKGLRRMRAMGFGEEPLEGRLSVAPFAPVVRRRTPPPADRRWTVGELVPLYAAEALSTHRGGGSELRSLLRVTQPLADRECSDVNAENLVPILEAVAVLAPVHANRMRAYYSAFCTWALEQDYTGYNPLVDVARLVDEAPRERTLSLSELVEIWQAAEELGRPFGPAIQLLILTAARRQDVAGMRRADLQPGDNGHLNWMVVMHKRGGSRPFMIPLSPLAQGIVERACRLSPPGSALVFTTTGSTPISGWSHAKRDLDEIICSRRSRAAVETQPEFSEWRFNDLRGSFVAVSERHLDGDSDILNRCLDRLTEVKGLIPRLLAHVDDKFELRREALFAWANLLEGAVS